MAKQTLRLGYPSQSFPFLNPPSLVFTTRAARNLSSLTRNQRRSNKEKDRQKQSSMSMRTQKEKRRTRSSKQLKLDEIVNAVNNQDENQQHHVPVLLGEVVDVFSSLHLRSFVDCTLGAAGHSSAIIRSHPELEFYVGMDVDPEAHLKARPRIDALLQSRPKVKVLTSLMNFKQIELVLEEASFPLDSGVDGTLMDLGMSSMQVNNPERGFSVLADGPLDMRMDPKASLKAEDVLNHWPPAEVGRILRDYGEESNWRFLQNKIVQARQNGGLHSTEELTDLIRRVNHGTRGGRQGWIKTATRVFQGLRIAVNNELDTLRSSLLTCFKCLAPGGRLAVISFHSLEDRIVKQTFLDIIGSNKGDGDEIKTGSGGRGMKSTINESNEKEPWIKQMVHGRNGSILTKRPITPSEVEETLNSRSRSAKLRVIEKAKSQGC